MKKVCLFFCLLLSGLTNAQTSMLAQYKAMPAFPVDAREAYKASKIEVINGYPSYIECSAPISNYGAKLIADQQQYTDIAAAKAAKTNPAAQKAANDFSDLNSPEMQAKIAKMSQEEQLKFAMEIQARMANNKNLKTINTVNKPSPISALTVKLNSSGHALILTLIDITESAFPGYTKCNNLCKETDPGCAKKVAACESKESHDFFNADIARYAAFLKNVQLQYQAKKTAFEADLKDFDAQATKYPKEDVASDYTSVYVLLGAIADRIKLYEKAGAEIIVKAKSNEYCKNDY